MKIILSEIKKNLQGIISGVDEAKNQINYLEHKEAKKTTDQSKQKKKHTPPKKMRKV